MQASIIWCLYHARINWESCGRKGIQSKNGGWLTDSPDGVMSRQIVSVSASDIFPCTLKSRRWQAIMDEVDEGCLTSSA